MKKLFCILLSVSLICLLAACSNDEEKNKSGNTVDLEYYASLGKMPEIEYTLGTDVNKIDKELSKRFDEELASHQEDIYDTHGHETVFYYEKVEGENNVLLDNGHFCYYYKKANKDKGVSYIVNYDIAYGFQLGTVISEIKDACPKIKFTEEPLNDDNAFFADYIENGTVLTYKFENTSVSFVFQNNELFATAIYNENWYN